MPIKKAIKGSKDMVNMFKEFGSAWSTRKSDYEAVVLNKKPKRKKKK
tara:strand:- start:1082 stop:1222 length:141 start_codon:yes stop_codon:yes gene_type:complete